MWEIRHGLTSNDLQITFVDNNRHGTIAKVPPLKKGCKMRHRSLQENSFAIMGPRIWNCIPGHIRKWDSLDLFKKHLTTFVLKVPDKPPIRGYSSPNFNSILYWRNEKDIPALFQLTPSAVVGDSNGHSSFDEQHAGYAG